MPVPPPDNRETWRALGWVLGGMLAVWVPLSPQPIGSNQELEVLRAKVDRLGAKVKALEAAGPYQPLTE